MYHLYPSLKGDQLCPLGFHPQTRYPTRCKRCFRDYKEHGGRRGNEDVASSSPNLSNMQNSTTQMNYLGSSSRTWTSTQNLSPMNNNNNNNNSNGDIVVHFNVDLKKRPQSWTSTSLTNETYDSMKASNSQSSSSSVNQNTGNDVEVTIKLPTPISQRHSTTLDPKEIQNSLYQSMAPSSSSSSSPTTTASLQTSVKSVSKDIPRDLVIRSTDTLAERARKMNLLKKQRSLSREGSVPKKTEGEIDCSDKINANKSERTTRADDTENEEKHLSIRTKKVINEDKQMPMNDSLTNNSALVDNTTISSSTSILMKVPSKAKILQSQKSKSSTTTAATSNTAEKRREVNRQKQAQDVQFMLNIKDKNYKDNMDNQDNMSLTTETPDALHNREFLEEINNLRAELQMMKARAEKAEREKSDLMLRRVTSIDTVSHRSVMSEALTLQKKVTELKEQLDKISEEKRKLNTRMKELENNPKNIEHELRRKLQAAEQICEELMEENQDAKKEIMNLQAEMDELQDSFREDDIKAKSCLQKDLEKTTKNCRILSFKLKKCERKIEQLEQERQSNDNDQLYARIKQLEEELHMSNELTKKLRIETEELRNPGNKRHPMLGGLGKSTSADGRITRESLTRGGSQEDPQQLQRDLQDSVERESDLKEQLKFAEEEAETLRKKVARMEDENDSLMMQLKKMTTRSRIAKVGMNSHRLASQPISERDEGISDEDDPAELRILLELNEQEASILRHKVEDLERQTSEDKKFIKELQMKIHSDSGSMDKRYNNSPLLSGSTERRIKNLNEEMDKLKKSINEKDQQMEQLRNNCSMEKSKTAIELSKLKKNVAAAEEQRDALKVQLSRILREAEDKLPSKIKVTLTDLTPRNQLKKWVEELNDENKEMRAILLNSGLSNLKSLESEKLSLAEDLNKSKQKISQLETDLKIYKNAADSSRKVEKEMEKFKEDSKNANKKIKDLEEKIKKNEILVKQNETNNRSLEQQIKTEKEKVTKLEKDYETERKHKEMLEDKLAKKESELQTVRKNAEKSLEKDAKSKDNAKSDGKQIQKLKKEIEELRQSYANESKRNNELNAKFEKQSEENVLSKAQLLTEKTNLEIELSMAKQKISELETLKTSRSDLMKKLADAQKKIQEFEVKTLKNNGTDYEKTLLQSKLNEKSEEYERLRRENATNIDLIFQLRKENDDLNKRLNDFSRVEQVQSSMNERKISLEDEIKRLKEQLQKNELQMKSEVASTRLRYEQQIKNLKAEFTSMHRQCERFKKDRDSLKLMLEAAQRKITNLNANNSGRQSRSSMHSSDEDDKNKIAYLEQQIGCLEDQLVEARLEASKVKTELVSERSANEIKISEMQSKLNEFEEERVTGSGRSRIPGVKTKLELSWQKEREEQQRLLQETSTLARDLRQTLFEVERERDKERLEAKRRLEQIKRTNEEEMEDGRKKISELQSDLLELRDVHAKLRTSNEKLRRERERYEGRLARRIIDQEEENKVNTLLVMVDELVKIIPTLIDNPQNAQKAIKDKTMKEPNSTTSEITTVLKQLIKASDDVRKYKFDDERERIRSRRSSNLVRASSQETDSQGSQNSLSTTTRHSSRSTRAKTNGVTENGMRKSLSLDQSIHQEHSIWDNGSVSSIQSMDSDINGLSRDSNLDSRLSGGSTQSDMPRVPRKKKKGLMFKLRNLTKSGRTSESDISVQGSDSDISVASDLRASKKDIRNRLSDMFKRSGSTSRSASAERPLSEKQKPVAVTIVGDEDGPSPHNLPPLNIVTPKPIRSLSKPPTPSPTTPLSKRKVIK